MDVGIGGLRKSYNDRSNIFLEENIAVKEPISLFKEWFQLVLESPVIREPTAVCLATATKNAIPSARMVLLKGYGKEGFIFYTNYTSRKGQELEENPNAAMTFYWESLVRSVRVEGRVEKLPFSNADDYFKTRPYLSQIGALASDQSKRIESRTALMKKAGELKEKYGEGQVPRPKLWGGFRLVPHTIEFWQGQSDRLHDRIRFRKPKEGEKPDGITTHQGEDGWMYERLQP